MDGLVHGCGSSLPPSSMAKDILWLFPLFRISFGIFNKAPNHKNHDDADWKCADDAHRLDVVHAALAKYQGNRKNDQKQAPQKCDRCMGLLVLSKFLIAVTGCCVCNGVKARRIKEYHAQHGNDQDERSCRHRLNDADNQAV